MKLLDTMAMFGAMLFLIGTVMLYHAGAFTDPDVPGELLIPGAKWIITSGIFLAPELLYRMHEYVNLP